MAKNSKKNSNKSNELDLILKQLKQSYGSESPDNDSKQSTNDDISEKDPELNAILDKIFSDEKTDSPKSNHRKAPKNDIKRKENDIVANEATVHENIPVESNANAFDTLSYDTLEPDPFEPDYKQKIVENNSAKLDDSFVKTDTENSSVTIDLDDAVDSLRQDDTLTDNGEEDLPWNSNDIITVADSEENVTNKNDLEKIYSTIDLEESIDVKEDVKDSVYIDDITAYNISDSDTDYEIIEDTEKSLISDISCEDESFAVEDEEYSVQDCQPKIILSRDEYTFDPLQEKLPDLRLGAFSGLSVIEKQTKKLSSDTQANNGIELNKNDISLLLKLGYDDEVKSQIGDENTQKALLENDSRFIPESNKTPFGFCGKEYSDKAQNREIKTKYRTQKKSLILSLAIISVLSLFILMTNLFFEFFSDRSSYLIVLGFELLLISIIALIIYKKIYIGLLGIVKFDINKYSILCYVMFTYIIYDILSIIVYLTSKTPILPSHLSMFGFAVSLYAVISLISDLFKCIQELSTFELLTASDKIFTLELQKNRSDLYNSNITHSNEPVSDSRKNVFNQGTYKICETTHISGYFKKTSQQHNDNLKYIMILGITPAISLLAGCICSFTGGSLMLGASAMMLTTLLCTPLVCIALPHMFEYLISNILRKNHSAFIGTEAPEILSKATAIIFKDVDAVEITSFTGIHPNNSEDSKKLMNLAAEVFAALGGSLSGAFALSEKNVSTNHSVIINSISDNGIDLYFDSSVNILIGDKAYLRSYNIKVKTDSNLSTATRGNEKSVIYMAINGSPKLGFIVSSKIKEPFSRIVSRLNSEGTRVFVESYEPQINDLFFEQSKSSSAAVTVYKPDTYESSRKAIVDGHAISTKSCEHVAELVPISKKIVSFRKKLRKIIMSTMIIGLLISLLFVLTVSISSSNSIIDAIRYHQSLLINMIFVGELIPGTVFLLNIKNNSKTHKNDKKHKNFWF